MSDSHGTDYRHAHGENAHTPKHRAPGEDPGTHHFESLTVPATGLGHQDAAQASGLLTFYNGLSTEQTVAAGTVLTGNDGVQVVTDTSIAIPPASPQV